MPIPARTHMSTLFCDVGDRQAFTLSKQFYYSHASPPASLEFCRCHFYSRPLRLKDLAVRKDANRKVVVRWYDAWRGHLGTGHLTDFALTSGKATGVWHANRLMSLFKCKFVGDHWSLTP